MKIVCVVPAAGTGKRLREPDEKAFVLLKGKPLIIHTLERIASSPLIDHIVPVISPKNKKRFKALLKKYKVKKIKTVAPGGKERSDSVMNGLCEAKEADIVLIHDGARPFVSKNDIKKVVASSKKYGAAIPAIPAKQTIKVVSKRLFIKNTPERKRLYEAQTPQGFRREIILGAYKKIGKSGLTDDAALAEKAGFRVKIVKGSSGNIKVTTPEDLKLAEILCE